MNQLPSLPKKICCHADPQNKFDYPKILKSLGFTFNEIEIDGNKLEVVNLPSNWKIVPAEDDYVFLLIDKKERPRASIMMCPGINWVNLFTKFDFMHKTKNVGAEKIIAVEVFELHEVVHSVSVTYLSSFSLEDRLEAIKKAKQQAIDWLDENYPDWKNPGAYWD
ncbi:MAG: hypothetical protein KBD10_00605 [Candidatus Pacebacteria bacterium]|nr:hypothetical protein [Candidatus Paceibacterota bacterium]